mgnify:CR=1 FL=1
MDLKINGAIKAAEEVVKSLNEATEDVTSVSYTHLTLPTIA